MKELLEDEFLCMLPYCFCCLVSSKLCRIDRQEPSNLVLKYSYLHNDGFLQRHRVQFLLIKQSRFDLSAWDFRTAAHRNLKLQR
jgi:hypothetical protein